MASVRVIVTVECSVPTPETAQALEQELESRLYRAVEALLPSLADAHAIQKGNVSLEATRTRQSKIQVVESVDRGK